MLSEVATIINTQEPITSYISFDCFQNKYKLVIVYPILNIILSKAITNGCYDVEFIWTDGEKEPKEVIKVELDTKKMNKHFPKLIKIMRRVVNEYGSITKDLLIMLGGI